jgi:hypothetical protein
MPKAPPHSRTLKCPCKSKVDFPRSLLHRPAHSLRLDHLVDELGHVLLPVTGVAALDETDELPGPPAAGGVGELEGPQGGRGLLEVGAAGGDLVNEVLNA